MWRMNCLGLIVRDDDDGDGEVKRFFYFFIFFGWMWGMLQKEQVEVGCVMYNKSRSWVSFTVITRNVDMY